MGDIQPGDVTPPGDTTLPGQPLAPAALAALPASQAIDLLSRSMPTPTNAQALAALEAVHQADDAAAGVAEGLAPELAEAWLPALGVLPRMRLLACGWTNPGDKLRSQNDAAWWSTPFRFALWEPLFTYATTLEASGAKQAPINWQQDLANGDVGELTQALLSVAGELGRLSDPDVLSCDPYVIPTKRGVQPTPRAACVLALRAVLEAERLKRKSDKKQSDRQKSGISLALLLAAAYVLAYHYKHGRAPWR